MARSNRHGKAQQGALQEDAAHVVAQRAVEIRQDPQGRFEQAVGDRSEKAALDLAGIPQQE